MRLADYLLVRFCINATRGTASLPELSTAELGILSLLHTHDMLTVSTLARIQHASRPTMTHRVSRLTELGLIERRADSQDHRSIQCLITSKGQEVYNGRISSLFEILPARLIRSSMRLGLYEEVCHQHCMTFMRRFFEMTAPINLSAGHLVMLVCFMLKDGVRVGDVVERTALLQPTISMTVKRLEKQHLITRLASPIQPLHTAPISLTPQGGAFIADVVSTIHGIQLHRPLK